METWDWEFIIKTVLGCGTGLFLVISFLHTLGLWDAWFRRRDDLAVGKYTLTGSGMGQDEACFVYGKMGTSDGRVDCGWDYDYAVLGT